MSQPFRVPPALPSNAYTSYGFVMPRDTHQVKISCERADCAARRNGWKTTVDVNTGLGAQQANYIRLHSGRRFTVTEDGSLVTFTFLVDQDCFADHYMNLEREPVFTKKRGDWRSGERPRVIGGTQWLDEFAANQEAIADAIKEG